MEKVNVVMIVLNAEFLKRAIQNLDFGKVELMTIITDSNEKTFPVGDKQIPINPFANVMKIAEMYKESFIWLIVGYKKDFGDIRKMKRFLMSLDVPEENIINFEMLEKTSLTWLANLRHIEKYGADFFATGNEYAQNGLSFDFIPSVSTDKLFTKSRVNLAYPNQDLQQSYLTAKYIFDNVKPGAIKFVLIGLTPDSFRRDNSANFFGFQRLLSIANTKKKPDLNFKTVKDSYKLKFSIKAIVNWKDNPKVLPEDAVEKNIQILKDYIELCLANGAKPIAVVFPVTLSMRKIFDEELLESFRSTIRQLEENYNFMCVDMFDLEFGYHRFNNMTQLGKEGRRAANAFISLKLFERNLIPLENFVDMNYNFFGALARFAPKDDYNDFMARVLNVTVERIRRKDKIRIGFVTLEAAQWCGEDLYNFFARDERFETTVFLSLDFHKEINELILNDFQRGIEQFRQHGISVVALNSRENVVPEQDIFISLTPYLSWLPKMFLPENMTPKTLFVHVPYAFDSALHNDEFYSKILFIIGWKVFFPSIPGFEIYDRKAVVGMPRGFYSGYPRMDVFFKKDTKFEFNWKMTRPDAKKIIWAPHHSIKGGPAIKYATFQWNYMFMYNFAKDHPEISWVVKPHPMLLYTSVTEGVFPTVEDFKGYLQAWDELPNAQVYTGAYYQDLFATSDGMIHDCASFISEYQFANKPMIYLTRDTQWHNDLGKAILDVSYLVDGQDLDGIAAAIQKIFIEGDDYKAAERKEVFDKYLNYFERNGMLASEFIYKSIADDLQKPSL